MPINPTRQRYKRSESEWLGSRNGCSAQTCGHMRDQACALDGDRNDLAALTLPMRLGSAEQTGALCFPSWWLPLPLAQRYIPLRVPTFSPVVPQAEFF